MNVTVDVAGADTHALTVEAGATYGDLLEAVDLRREEAAVLVGGRPVPTDAAVEADSVRVVRLVEGG